MDDSGKTGRDPQDGVSPTDPSGEDLQLYLEESWGAIQEIAQREQRSRRVRGWAVTITVAVVIGVLAYLALTFVEFRDPLGVGGRGIVAWLVVPQPGSDAITLFPPGKGRDSKVIRLATDLAPVQALSARDEVELADGVEAVFYLPGEDLRQTYQGPCNLTMLPAGPTITGGSGQLINTQPITSWIKALKSGADDPVDAASGTGPPELIYPLGCNTFNGSIHFRWAYGREAVDAVVTVRTMPGEPVQETEIEAGTGSLAVNLDPGRGYRWSVAAGQEVSGEGQFRILGDSLRGWIAQAAKSCGMDGEDIVAEAAMGSNLYRLCALYTILEENDLPREADAVLTRLKAVSGVE